MKRATRALIFKKNLRNNIQEIKKCISKETKLCIAVKADAYGHNALLTAQIAEEENVEYLAIATIQEAIELRQSGIRAKLLLLSLCTPEEFSDIFTYQITPLVFGKDYIEELSNTKTSKKAEVFLAIDTGMGRVGCYADEAGEEAKLIQKSSNLKLAGMITHFAVSDSLNAEDEKFTREQYKEFLKAVENVKKEGIEPGIRTCANSAAILNNKDMHFDMVRPGIITYGYYPDEITKEYLEKNNIKCNLKPVMALETKVVAIRHFPKGKSISYGRTWTTTEDTDIAILPIGYADGLLRRFSPGLFVTINGKNYPVRGRICMDQCMIDIGKNNNDVKLWDTAVIFGPKESGALNTADDLAKLGNTISYEVLTSITKRVERFIIS